MTDSTYYAYVRSTADVPPGGEPGRVDILATTDDWHEALNACAEYAAHVHRANQDIGTSDTAGLSAIGLFAIHLRNVWPCEVSTLAYSYIIGISERLPVGLTEMRVDLTALLPYNHNLSFDQLSELITDVIAYFGMTS